MRRFLNDHRRPVGLAMVGLTAIVALSITVLAGGAGASGTPAAGKPTALRAPAAPVKVRAADRPGQSKAAILAYWTKDRMRHAKPMLVSAGRRSASAAANAGNTATGRPGFAGGYIPRGLPRMTGYSPVPSGSAGSSGVLPADGGFPGPNQTYDWYPKYRVYPVSTIGVLFFTDLNGANQFCTAAVTSGGSDLDSVWTGGQCVGPRGGAKFYSNFMFCPSYLHGVNPAVGCWPWANALQPGHWYTDGYWFFDYAWVKMQPGGSVINDHVANVTGALGFGYNQPRDQLWMDFGYPDGSPYPGGAIVLTAAEHRYVVTNPDSCGPPVCFQDNSIGSAQSPAGIAGGPWVLSFGKTGTDPIPHGNWINSTNSYFFASGPNGNEAGKEIQGPYYDTRTCDFWKDVTGWPGTC